MLAGEKATARMGLMRPVLGDERLQGRGGGVVCTREGVEHAARLVVEDVDAAVLVARGCEPAVSGLGFALALVCSEVVLKVSE